MHFGSDRPPPPTLSIRGVLPRPCVPSPMLQRAKTQSRGLAIQFLSLDRRQNPGAFVQSPLLVSPARSTPMHASSLTVLCTSPAHVRWKWRVLPQRIPAPSAVHGVADAESPQSTGRMPYREVRIIRAPG